MTQAARPSADQLEVECVRVAAVAATMFPSLTRDVIVDEREDGTITLFIDLRTRDGQRFAIALPLALLGTMSNLELTEAVRQDGIRLGLLTRAD